MVLFSGCTSEPQWSFCGNPCHKMKSRFFPLDPLLRLYEGSALGQMLPMDEQIYPARVLYGLLSTGRPHEAMAWSSKKNPQISGVLQVLPLTTKPGTYCRPYMQTLEIAKKRWQAKGLACRADNEVWFIVEESPYHF